MTEGKRSNLYLHLGESGYALLVLATPADWWPGDNVIVPTAGSCGVAKDKVLSTILKKQPARSVVPTEARTPPVYGARQASLPPRAVSCRPGRTSRRNG